MQTSPGCNSGSGSERGCRSGCPSTMPWNSTAAAMATEGTEMSVLKQKKKEEGRKKKERRKEGKKEGRNRDKLYQQSNNINRMHRRCRLDPMSPFEDKIASK